MNNVMTSSPFCIVKLFCSYSYVCFFIQNKIFLQTTFLHGLCISKSGLRAKDFTQPQQA